MQIVKGDLWDYHAQGWKIVISTNIGWSDREGHANNMGAGIALQAALRWPWLPSWLGSHYRAVHLFGAKQRPVERPELGLIFVAVKPLIETDPEYSWNQKASPKLIAEQLGMLTSHEGDIALGFIGCGNGALDRIEVMPALINLIAMRKEANLGRTAIVDREA